MNRNFHHRSQIGRLIAEPSNAAIMDPTPVLGFHPHRDGRGQGLNLNSPGSTTDGTPYSPLSVAIRKAKSSSQLSALKAHRRSLSMNETGSSDQPECSTPSYEEWRGASAGSGIPIPNPETR